MTATQPGQITRRNSSSQRLLEAFLSQSEKVSGQYEMLPEFEEEAPDGSDPTDVLVYDGMTCSVFRGRRTETEQQHSGDGDSGKRVFPKASSLKLDSGGDLLEQEVAIKMCPKSKLHDTEELKRAKAEIVLHRMLMKEC